MVSRNNTCGAVVAVEVTRNQSTVRYSDREGVEREIMRCLSKRFSLTNKNSSMSTEFTSTVGYCGQAGRRSDFTRADSGSIVPR